MSTTTFSPVNRRFSSLEELEHATTCLHAGLQRVAEGTAVLRVDAPTLFLLANGIERYLKVGVHILTHERDGDFADFSTMKRYGHDLLLLQAAILELESPGARSSTMAREDLDFLKDDLLLRQVVECLDAFGRSERHFLLDGASGKPVDPDRSPKARWQDILELASDHDPALDTEKARRVVGAKLIGRIQRFLRCISQTVCSSTPGSRHLADGMEVYLSLKDRDLEVPVEPR